MEKQKNKFLKKYGCNMNADSGANVTLLGGMLADNVEPVMFKKLNEHNGNLTAKTEHVEKIFHLVQNTIKKVYPRYYAKEAVNFFVNCTASKQ